MHGHRFTRILVLTGSLLVVGLLAGLVPAVYAECPGNALNNAGFEEGGSERGAGEVYVANGWSPWWQEGPFQSDGYNVRPEFKLEDASRYGRLRVREGNWAQKWFNTFSTHHAGLYQQAKVPAHSVVTVKAWGQAWSSAEDNPKYSKNGKYFMSVGIDPTGGTDFASPNVVWSERNATLDEWVELTVQAKAQGGTVTIYLRGDAEWRIKHNDVYFDDICVTYVAPTPPPTNTPLPTNTPAPTEVPTGVPTATSLPDKPTAIPAPTQVPTVEPKLAGIRVLAFDDSNDNGIKDAGELTLAGAQIQLTNMQRTPLAVYTSTGSPDPHVFQDLAAGNYIVTEKDPPGYSSTSPNQWAVTLLDGTQVNLYFADRAEPSPTPAETKAEIVADLLTETPVADKTAEPEPTEEKKGWPIAATLYSVSGINMALLALLLPFALRALRAILH